MASKKARTTTTPIREFEATVGERELRQGWMQSCWAELGTAILCLITGYFWPSWQGAWVAAAVVEAALTMATLTLTDIATRLEKKPSILVGILICAGVGVIYMGQVGFAFATAAGESKNWLAILLATSTLAQRARIVWTMPQGGALDRMRHRALAADRAFMLALLTLLTFGVGYFRDYFPPDAWWLRDDLAFPVAYATLALFTAARIPYLLSDRFAAKPKALFYDVLGVDYLARL